MPVRVGQEIQAVLRRGDGELKDSRAATRAAGRERAHHENRGMGERASLVAPASDNFCGQVNGSVTAHRSRRESATIRSRSFPIFDVYFVCQQIGYYRSPLVS